MVLAASTTSPSGIVFAGISFRIFVFLNKSNLKTKEKVILFLQK